MGVRLLVVEDELANCALIRAILERAERAGGGVYAIVETHSLAEARRALASPIDVVLLDARLPDGSGLELMAELEARQGPKRPRVIVQSAGVLAHEREAAFEHGADGFLAKPYDADTLLELLAQGSARGPGEVAQ